MARYSVANQEKFFQTCRVQLISESEYHYSRTRYHICVRDTQVRGQKAILKTLRQRKADGALLWPEELKVVRVDTLPGMLGGPDRQVARYEESFEPVFSQTAGIAEAKLQAVRLNLPFDPERDVLFLEEVTNGPQAVCVACGEESKTVRTFEPFVCQTCKMALGVGRGVLARQEREEHVIAPGDLLCLRYLDIHERELWDKGSHRLAALLVQLAGSAIGGHPPRETQWKERIGMHGDGRHPYNDTEKRVGRVVQLAPGQRETLQAIVDLVNDLLASAYNDGHSEGRSLLMSLARGERTADDFNKYSTKVGQPK